MGAGFDGARRHAKRLGCLGHRCAAVVTLEQHLPVCVRQSSQRRPHELPIYDPLRRVVYRLLGNLVGSIGFAGLVNASGVLSAGAPAGQETVFMGSLAGIVKAKAALTGGQLFFRSILCNMLVCLALWMASRTRSDAAKLGRCRPVLERVPGWSADLAGVRRRADLPDAARRYIDRIEALVGKPIKLVSVGPDRDQTILS